MIFMYDLIKEAVHDDDAAIEISKMENKDVSSVVDAISELSLEDTMKLGMQFKRFPLGCDLTEVVAGTFDISGDFSPEFIEAMTAVMPTVAQKREKPLSMRELSNVAGLKLDEFCKLIASNIYKNPRPIAMQMMLNRAADMLLRNRQKDIAEISDECGFISPNFFIASFYHNFRV